MNGKAPDLYMLNVIVADMPASLDFYRQLGVVVPDGDVTAGAHVQLRMPSGFSLELDTAESARLWHAAWRTDPAGASVIIGFSLPTREAVDERYAALMSAGYQGRQPVPPRNRILVCELGLLGSQAAPTYSLIRPLRTGFRRI